MDSLVAGNVGVPSSTVEIKLVSIPEMSRYVTSDPPSGEICIRGTTLFSHYLNKPEETKAVVDEDGWFHTGDVGQWNVNGTLSIVDRKKNIFKLAQGEYIAPEKIENIFQRNRFVSQIFIHGSPLEAHLLAVVVPDEETLVEWASSHTALRGLKFSELCSSSHVKTHLMSELNATGKSAGLKGYELVRGVFVEHQQFSTNDGTLTPSMKLVRPQATKKYLPHFEKLYEEIRQATAET
eukprot:TRINITY_DN4655_c0_g1_i2.p1 TRINITY_DN4655_c0_g1~~TRINITY_DN4655_c0_g1_i2.p1  ORF type:complete len:237 (+),score=69.62 TRINITY_DN4655_c0_g1_i2:235-945(+)